MADGRFTIAKARTFIALIALAPFLAGLIFAEEPSVSYIFPAGGQRGTTVNFRVGGHFLHGEAGFEMLGPGVTATPRVRETNTVWFEGPFIPQPLSQQTENYPRDHAGSVRLAADAPPGARFWRVWTSQGTTPAMKFIVGDLPEVIEQEADGAPIPVEVKPPVTINGRIFPRENVDVWTFRARAGEEFTCSVAAQSLGSPLQARLVALDPGGRQITEAIATQRGDPRLHFKTASDGLHSIRIHDVSFGGLQHYVYRLTITSEPVVERFFPLGARRGDSVKLELSGQALPSRTTEVKIPSDAARTFSLPLVLGGKKTNPITLDVDDLPELIHRADTSFTTPAVLNGRILQPGQTNEWTFTTRKGEALELTLAAPRLGSSLTPVLAIADAQGKQLARAEAAPGELADTTLAFKAPDDGTFLIRVSERFASRGGPDFAYRLRVAPPAAPDFQLTLAADTLNVLRDLPEGLAVADPAKKPRGKQKPGQLKLNVTASGGFAGEIELSVDGLPPLVSVSNTKIPAKRTTHDLAFAAEPTAKISASRIVIHGTATINGQTVTRTAAMPARHGEATLDSVLLAVALPTPFKHHAEYLFALGPRGSTFQRHYQLDRNGFTGPITVRFADRQGRHLQGVTGPAVVVPPGAEEFDFTVTLPPWMEIGRTSRTQLMSSGVVRDHDGTEHIVSYTSNDQSDQIIVVTSAGLLSVEAERRTLAATPGRTVEVKLRVQREKSIEATAVRVELAVPAHVKGVQAQPVIVPAGKGETTLRVEFATNAGPFNLPFTLRATTLDAKNPHFAEGKIEFVPPAESSRSVSAR